MRLEYMVRGIERVRKQNVHSPTTPITYEILTEIVREAIRLDLVSEKLPKIEWKEYETGL